MKKLVLVVLAVLLVGGIVYAADNPKDATAMVDKAVSYFQANGQVKAFAAFDDPKGQFVKGDLYIYVLNMQGDIVSHGANKKLIGQHILGYKDTDGKLFIQEILDKAQKQGTVWVDYKWSNPVSKKGIYK